MPIKITTVIQVAVEVAVDNSVALGVLVLVDKVTLVQQVLEITMLVRVVAVQVQLDLLLL